MNKWRAEERANIAELKEEMASIDEAIAGGPQRRTSRTQCCSAVVLWPSDRMEGTVDGIAAQNHGLVMEPVAEFPIRDEAKLDELIQKITENPSSSHALVI